MQSYGQSRTFARLAKVAAAALLLAKTVFAGYTARSDAVSPFIVQDGVAGAEIIVSAAAPGSIRLAATELKSYVKKISGAELQIVNRASDNDLVAIVVGDTGTEDPARPDISGLPEGAFVLKTAGRKLYLLGNDIEFSIRDKKPRKPADLQQFVAEWEKEANGMWSNPGRSDLGWSYNKKYDMWSCDSHGTLNAVYEFLRSLGVRWYMPGEIGEVVPQTASIPLPLLDKTISPAFPSRVMSFNRYSTQQEDHFLWGLRMGLNKPYGYHLAHGMDTISNRAVREAHPEFFSMFKGVRQPLTTHHCYSSEGLFQETVRMVRALYDIYDVSMVSVMPSDGFSFACECPECLPQATPHRINGKYSDYIWAFVDRVAQEVYKTHPDRFVSCCAYSTYLLPPERIEKFHPNVVVGIVGGRTPRVVDEEGRAKIRELQQGWAARTDNKIMLFENYPFTKRAKFVIPVICPHGVSASMREIQDFSMGEEVWMSEERGLHAPELSHINIYSTALCLWDPETDIDQKLDEYCRLFYGPAGDTMRAFIDHCENNSKHMVLNPQPSQKEKTLAVIDKTFALLDKAAEETGDGNVFAERVKLLSTRLESLKEMRNQIARGREKTIPLRIANLPETGLVLDGRLDDAVWQNISGVPMKDLVSGEEPEARTFLKAFWSDDSLYLGFRCEDPDMANLNITTTEDDDARIWLGDVLELLIETDKHSFYQIVVNPLGKVLDLDRNVSKHDLTWDALASVEATRDDNAWTIEMRILVLPESDDPLHNLVGSRPSEETPWYFNFCRQRVRDGKTDFSAYSPTGVRAFADVMKFARLYSE